MESDSNLFENLTTKTLNTVSATNIDALTRDIHLERANQEALLATVLVNDASMRASGTIIPGTGAIKLSEAVTDNTRTTWFRPNPGEVWVVDMAGFVWTDKTGDAGLTMYYYDGTTALDVAYLSNTATGSSITARLSDDGSWEWPFHVDENCYIQFVAGSASNWASGQFQGACWRIR